MINQQKKLLNSKRYTKISVTKTRTNYRKQREGALRLVPSGFESARYLLLLLVCRVAGGVLWVIGDNVFVGGYAAAIQTVLQSKGSVNTWRSFRGDCIHLPSHRRRESPRQRACRRRSSRFAHRSRKAGRTRARPWSRPRFHDLGGTGRPETAAFPAVSGPERRPRAVHCADSWPYLH